VCVCICLCVFVCKALFVLINGYGRWKNIVLSLPTHVSFLNEYSFGFNKLLSGENGIKN